MSDAGDLLPGSSLPSHNAETVEALLPEDHSLMDLLFENMLCLGG